MKLRKAVRRVTMIEDGNVVTLYKGKKKKGKKKKVQRRMKKAQGRKRGPKDDEI